MYWIILLGLVGVVLGTICDFWLDTGSWFFGLFSALLGIIGGLIIGLSMGASVATVQLQTKHEKLVALRDTTATTGSFFLGSGSVNDNLTYFYYADKGTAGIQPGQVAPDLNDHVAFYEDSTPQTANLDVYETRSVKHSRWYITSNNDTTYKFHLPKDSILQNYTLNLGAK